MAEKASVYFKKVARKIGKNQVTVSENIIKMLARDSDKYTPEDTGKTRLEMDVNIKNYTVTWSNPYVEFIYWGIDLNFQKRHNPNAQSQWADRAIQEDIDEVANDYIDAIVSAF